MSVSAKTGGYRAILERLFTWVDTALDDGGYFTYHITNDEDFSVSQVKNMPVVTISLGRASVVHEVYGRKYPSTGVMVIYPFSLYIYHYRNRRSSENHNLNCTTAMDYIVNYFNGRDQNSTEQGTHNIINVLDVEGRESDPRWDKRLARMIVTGSLKVKRLD